MIRNKIIFFNRKLFKKTPYLKEFIYLQNKIDNYINFSNTDLLNK